MKTIVLLAGKWLETENLGELIWLVKNVRVN